MHFIRREINYNLNTMSSSKRRLRHSSDTKHYAVAPSFSPLGFAVIRPFRIGRVNGCVTICRVKFKIVSKIVSEIDSLLEIVSHNENRQVSGSCEKVER